MTVPVTSGRRVRQSPTHDQRLAHIELVFGLSNSPCVSHKQDAHQPQHTYIAPRKALTHSPAGGCAPVHIGAAKFPCAATFSFHDGAQPEYV